MEIIISIGIFIGVILFIEGGYFVFKANRASERKRLKSRLRSISSGGESSEEISILRKRLLSEIPWLNRTLLRITNIHSLDRLLEEANARHSLGYYILLTILCAVCGYIAGSMLQIVFIMRLTSAVLAGSVPFLLVSNARIRRMRKFERQLPDALDLIVRSLRAGHAFTGGIKMVADEFDDPVGTEFAKVMDEVNFGIGVPEALKNFSNRIDCPDLKFFVVAVIIQRDTGGNLAEVLEKISYLIRERFKLQGKVRSLSAEGKLSAIVLVALPLLMVLYLMLVNPDYLMTLLTDQLGKIMVALSSVMMVIGIYVIKKMITIRV